MDKEQIIKIAAEAAIEKWEKLKVQEVQSIHDERLNNTKLLLKNYHLFQKHCEKSIYNWRQAIANETGNEDRPDDAAEFLRSLEGMNKNAFVSSIKQNAAVTYVILAHVNKMLQVYELYCEQSERAEDKRRYRIIKAAYLDEKRQKAMEICSAEKIDDSTYYRDLHESFEMISALIFGVEGLTSMRKR